MSKQPAPLTVWVPPGGSLLTSPGVEVRGMTPPVQERQPNEQGAIPERGPERFRPPKPVSPDQPEKPVRPERPERPVKRAKPAGKGLRGGLPGGEGGPRRAGAGGKNTGWVFRPGRQGSGGPQGPLVGDLESELAYVTPELLATADEVMAQYDMKVSNMTFITAKPDKGGAIWRIDTNHGPRSLKQLHRPAARSAFSVGAQVYLKEKGARVPEMILAKDRLPYVEKDGKLWIVTEWVQSLFPASKVDLEGAQALCYGLGEFHRHSRGYEPPHGAQKASRIYRWPKTYAKVHTKLGWFRTIAEAYGEMPASGTLLSVIDTYEQQARQAYERLLASPYPSLVGRGETAWGLAHQDS